MGTNKSGRVRCRCCNTKETSEKLIQNDRGSTKSYMDILTETFNVQMSRSEEWRLCLVCAVRLREASAFRKMVESTEKQFLLRHPGIKKIDTLDQLVKLEPADLNIDQCDDYNLTREDDNYDDRLHCNDADFSEDDDKPLWTVKDKKIPDKMEKKIHNLMGLKDLKSIIDVQLIPKINMDKLYQVNKFVRELIKREGDDYVLPPLEARMRPLAETKLLTDYKRENVRMVLPLRVPKFQRAPRKSRSAKLAKVPKTTDLLIKQRQSSEKRAARKIIIRNALTILSNTTAIPFIYFHSNFKCFYCRETFFGFSPLKTHVLENHPDIKNDARKVKAFRDILMVDISDLKCRRCGQNCDSIEEIKDHLVEAHSVAINTKHKDDIMGFKLNGDNYNCHLCSDEFHVFRNLSLHVNKHYANYMCEVCGKPFISYERYRNHEVTHADGVFKCAKCDQAFSTMKMRAAHYVSEHRMMRYGCPMCSERFEKYLDRTVHLSNVHSVTYSFKCPHCAKQFFHKPHMRAHIQNMHRMREKKVECKECGMKFTDNNALSRHMISHTGEKLFVCRLCGKRYGRKYSLNEHMRAHARPHRGYPAQ